MNMKNQALLLKFEAEVETLHDDDSKLELLFDYINLHQHEVLIDYDYMYGISYIEEEFKDEFKLSLLPEQDMTEETIKNFQDYLENSETEN